MALDTLCRTLREPVLPWTFLWQIDCQYFIVKYISSNFIFGISFMSIFNIITLLDSWSTIFVSGWLGIFPSPNISWRSAHLWGDPPGSADDIEWPLEWPLCGHHQWLPHPAPGQRVQWEWDRAVPGPGKQSQQATDPQQGVPSAWWKNKQKILYIPQKNTWDKQKPQIKEWSWCSEFQFLEPIWNPW